MFAAFRHNSDQFLQVEVTRATLARRTASVEFVAAAFLRVVSE